MFGIGESRIDFPVELLDDVVRHVLGSDDAKHRAHLIARHEFAHRRDVRQLVRTWLCRKSRASRISASYCKPQSASINARVWAYHAVLG